MLFFGGAYMKDTPSLVINSYSEEIYHFTGSANSMFSHVITGITNPQSSYEIRRNASKAFSIEYIYEGEGVIQQDNKIFRVTAGDFFILYPNRFHHYFASPKNPWKKIWIVIEGNFSFLNTLFDLYKINNTVLLKGVNNPLRLDEIFEAIKYNSADIEQSLETLLFQMIREIAVHSQVQSDSESLAVAGKRYIDKMIYTRITVQDVCDKLAISRSYFFRLFKNEFGISPNDYIIASKINIAKKYLEETALSILHISERLAFTDTSHFSRTFKSVTGDTPVKYREKFR